MTPESQNIAIAESLGYKAVKDKSGHWDLTHPKVSVEKSGWFLRKDAFLAAPNYHSSLDACAEFEEKLTEDDQQRNYAWYLVQICDPHEQFRLWKSPDELSIWEMGLCDCFTCASAKPNQRCEAYLRTLKLWKESK